MDETELITCHTAIKEEAERLRKDMKSCLRERSDRLSVHGKEIAMDYVVDIVKILNDIEVELTPEDDEAEYTPEAIDDEKLDDFLKELRDSLTERIEKLEEIEESLNDRGASRLLMDYIDSMESLLTVVKRNIE